MPWYHLPTGRYTPMFTHSDIANSNIGQILENVAKVWFSTTFLKYIFYNHFIKGRLWKQIYISSLWLFHMPPPGPSLLNFSEVIYFLIPEIAFTFDLFCLSPSLSSLHLLWLCLSLSLYICTPMADIMGKSVLFLVYCFPVVSSQAYL